MGRWGCVFLVSYVVLVMGRGSNPLGLLCSSVLEFCKGMGFKTRSFQCILLLFCFKRQQLLSSFGYGQWCACEGKSLLPTVYCSWLVCSIPGGLTFLGFLPVPATSDLSYWVPWSFLVCRELSESSGFQQQLSCPSSLWAAEWCPMRCQTVQSLPRQPHSSTQRCLQWSR